MAKLNPDTALQFLDEDRLNPLTERLLRAEEMVEQAWRKMAGEYGVPLYTVVPSPFGKGVNEWPEDPETCSPEEFAYLIQTRGQDAVDLWVAQFYFLKAQARQYDEGANDYGGPESVADSAESY